MAGGGGTRFWPEGRQARPKQFLPLSSEQTLLQETSARCAGLIPPERQWVVTNARYAAETQVELPDMPVAHILSEPVGRNTAPCIGLAAMELLRVDANAVMLVLPADHAIRPVEKFVAAVESGLKILQRQPESLVLFGAPPVYPATGFGYIEQGEALPAELPGFAVRSFHEKPNRERATEFMATGRHLWNCGIFLWRAAQILALLREFQPELYAGLQKIQPSLGTAEYAEILAREFPLLPAVSIDKGVIERAEQVAVLPAPFEWADIGTWQALGQFLGTDAQGNTLLGAHCIVDTEDCFIRTDNGHMVATIGLKNCVIVHTPDATLVARKDDEDGLRKLVRLLEEQGHGRFL